MVAGRKAGEGLVPVGVDLLNRVDKAREPGGVDPAMCRIVADTRSVLDGGKGREPFSRLGVDDVEGWLRRAGGVLAGGDEQVVVTLVEPDETRSPRNIVFAADLVLRGVD